MRIQLLIAELNESRRKKWEKAFYEIERVAVRKCNAKDLMACPDVDAMLMIGMLAHERFGGKSQIGKSQVLSTRGKTGMPRWVVTTAPSPAHFEKKQVDGIMRSVLVPDQQLSPAEETYAVFVRAFEAIEEFNNRNQDKIQTLGFEPEFLNFRGEIADEIAAVRKAYLDFTQKDHFSGKQNEHFSRLQVG